MQLSAPKFVTFVISLLLFIIGMVAYFVVVPFVSDYAIWVILASFVLLAASCVFKGL